MNEEQKARKRETYAAWRVKKLQEDPDYFRRAALKWYYANLEKTKERRPSRKWQREYMREYYRKNPEKIKEIQERSRAKRREQVKAIMALVAKSPDQKARQKMHTEIKAGRMIKPDRCSKCGKQCSRRQLQAHHTDYSKPLEVTWLCTRCHGEAHWI